MLHYPGHNSHDSSSPTSANRIRICPQNTQMDAENEFFVLFCVIRRVPRATALSPTCAPHFQSDSKRFKPKKISKIRRGSAERLLARHGKDNPNTRNNRKIVLCPFFMRNALPANSFQPQPKQTILRFIRKNYGWVYPGGGVPHHNLNPTPNLNPIPRRSGVSACASGKRG